MRHVLVLVAVCCTAAIAACGSSGRSSRVATSRRYTQALKHAACMRSHGVPSFPDPSANGAPNPLAGHILASPAFRSATQACQSLNPDGGAVPSLSESQKLSAIEFSQCMRGHGVPNYPDPQFGALGYRLSIPPGLDPNSPAVKRAEIVCNRSAESGVGSTGNS